MGAFVEFCTCDGMRLKKTGRRHPASQGLGRRTPGQGARGWKYMLYVSARSWLQIHNSFTHTGFEQMHCIDTLGTQFDQRENAEGGKEGKNWRIRIGINDAQIPPSAFEAEGVARR